MNKGVYIHIPFCKSKCPYCDFYSVTDLSLTEAYVKAVINNVRHIKCCIDSVYFGGGTPSLLNTGQLDRILSQLAIKRNAEITMEMNPGDADAEYLKAAREIGINRISFGIQSLNDNELSVLGRRHNAQEAVISVLNAQKADFNNISADIMLGIPGQRKDTLFDTLTAVAKLPLQHISAYILKIEKDTPFHTRTDIIKLLPDEDSVADMYLQAVDLLSNAGYEQYEISNFARKGYECRHNLKYWSGGEYYGIGPAAHSCINGVRFACGMSVFDFISAGRQENTVTDESANSYAESAMLKLRLTKSGFNAAEEPKLKEKVLKAAQPLVKAGLVNQDGDILTLTPKGCLVSNEIMVRLFFINT